MEFEVVKICNWRHKTLYSTLERHTDINVTALAIIVIIILMPLVLDVIALEN